MPDHDSLKQPASARRGWLIALGWIALFAVLTTALTGVLFWRMGVEVTDEARRMAEGIAAKFDKTMNFTPEIRVDSVVVVNASTPVFELVTQQKQALVRYEWSHTWMHSTKKIEIEAVFTAKAGFDLSNTFTIQIDPRTGTIGATLPPAKLLSLGMSEVRIPRDEDGLWNKLTAEDREKAFKALEGRARKELVTTTFMVEANNEAERRIRDLLREDGGLLKIDPSAPASSLK